MLLYLRQNTHFNPGTVIFQELLLLLLAFPGIIKGTVNIISIVTFHLTRRATPGLTTVDWMTDVSLFNYKYASYC